MGIGEYINSMLGSPGLATSISPTQATTISSGGTGGMFGGIYAAPPPPMSVESDLKLSKLQQYVEMCDDTLEYVHLGRNMETKDPKISILKLASVGEFIKNVGLKYSDNSYYIIREKE